MSTTVSKRCARCGIPLVGTSLENFGDVVVAHERNQHTEQHSPPPPPDPCETDRVRVAEAEHVKEVSMPKHNGLAVVCLADPQPGDFCCIPAGGWMGTGIEVAQFLAGDRFEKYEHAEVYVGRPDARGPHGYTVSAYPSNGKQGGTTGLRALPCAPRQLAGSMWSSGIIELTPVERSGIVAWCMTHTDVLYSWPDYGAIALHRLGIKTPALKEYIASTGHMICSQYTDSAMLLGGDVHLFDDGRWPGDVTPGDLSGMLETAAHLAAMRPQE